VETSGKYIYKFIYTLRSTMTVREPFSKEDTQDNILLYISTADLVHQPSPAADEAIEAYNKHWKYQKMSTEMRIHSFRFKRGIKKNNKTYRDGTECENVDTLICLRISSIECKKESNVGMKVEVNYYYYDNVN
jgi:hypothetical protein